MKERVLWAVSALVILAGCQKSGGFGKEIRFRAATIPESATRTVYSGEISNSMERINWSTEDMIRIYSTEAACNNDDAYHWADYVLSGITVPQSMRQRSEASQLDVDHPTRGGLAWGDASTYHFYSIYPPPETDEALPGTVLGTTGAPFSCAIPALQVGIETEVEALFEGANESVYYPSMSNAFMVAYDSKSKDQAVNLLFEPAYTAFHISAGAPLEEGAKTIKRVTLSSSGTGSTALAGAFTAYYDSGWNYGVTGSGMTVSFTFPDGPYTITPGETVEFVLFALPQTLTNLTLTFVLNDGTTRILDLKTAGTVTIDGESYVAGEFLRFKPCKKHLIRGLLVGDISWSVDGNTTVKMKESVAPWDVNEQDVEYGRNDPVVNATKLTSNSSGYSFSIFAPKDELWKISVLDAPGGNIATDVNIILTEDGNPTNTIGSGTLQGTIGSPQKVEFMLSTTTHGTYYLSFSIIVDGTEYSINSELNPATGVPTAVTL